MNIEIKTKELQKRKLFVATPMYGGQCAGVYAQSLANLMMLCEKYGIKTKLACLFNESLITRGRNNLADAFLKSDCTHMMFIDSDIGFDPKDVVALLALAEPNSNKEIIAATYPKKTINWERIKNAVERGGGGEKGELLEKFSGRFPHNYLKSGETQLQKPVEVSEIGTGFMLIQKSAFKKFKKAYPELWYRDEVTYNKIMMYFQALIDPESKRYLSEDYMFCTWARRAGMKVWLCPWIELRHVGTYTFKGSMLSLAGETFKADYLTA